MLDYVIDFLSGFRCLVVAVYYWLFLVFGTGGARWRGHFYLYLNGVDWFDNKTWGDADV